MLIPNSTTETGAYQLASASQVVAYAESHDQAIVTHFDRCRGRKRLRKYHGW